MASATAAPRLRRLARHLARIRYRLLLINVLVAAVPLVGISFAKMHETQLLGALESDMIHQAAMVSAMVTAAPDKPLADFEPVLISAATSTRIRIRLLDATAQVRADSHRGGPPEGFEPPEPHLLSRGEPRTRAAEPPRGLDDVAGGPG